MGTFLFDSAVFGPVHSRRLGVSLGINLLPNDCKLCNFDCIYCECGLNQKGNGKKVFNSRSVVKESLHTKLKEMVQNNELPDVITFAGNGEPTMHPDFSEIIDDTIVLRNEYAPDCKIAVLSNATMLHKKEVVEALKKVDQNIQKLDSAFDSTVQIMNQPLKKVSVAKVVEDLKIFNGDFILQTLFLKGEYKGVSFDNTLQEELDAWEKIVEELCPKELMIYTISRDTPISTLEKIGKEKLDTIAEIFRNKGFKVQVSY